MWALSAAANKEFNYKILSLESKGKTGDLETNQNSNNKQNIENPVNNQQ